MKPVSDLLIVADARRHLRQAAEDAYPLEACGAMFGADNRVVGIRPLPNQSSDPDHSYEIAPSDLEPLLREEAAGGPSVIGFYHSHPDAHPWPSVRDRERALSGYWYVIVGVEQGAATSQSAWRSTRA